MEIYRKQTEISFEQIVTDFRLEKGIWGEAMLQIVREQKMASELRKALRGNTRAMIAVAFWGNGAAKALGLHKGSNVRIICNLGHPGCNPDAIDELRKLRLKIKSHPRLHAKIYVTQSIAIVGSSNVSSNGFTVEGKEAAGWVEANVITDSSDLIAEASELFETLWKSDECQTVRKSHITAARERRSRLAWGRHSMPANLPLFDSVRRNPGDFSNVFVAPYSEDLGKAAKKALTEMRKGAMPPKRGLTQTDFRKAWGYQFENIPEDAWLIDINCFNRNKPRVAGVAKTKGLRVRVNGDDGPETDLTIAVPEPIIIGSRPFSLSKSEKKLLIDYAGRILKLANDRVIPLQKVIKMIDRLERTKLR